MTKYGYADIIGDVVSTEDTILGSVGGKFLSCDTKKRVNRISAIGRYIDQTRSYQFLTATYLK